jgi:tetratricopeptide (TPR) repeat protein
VFFGEAPAVRGRGGYDAYRRARAAREAARPPAPRRRSALRGVLLLVGFLGLGAVLGWQFFRQPGDEAERAAGPIPAAVVPAEKPILPAAGDPPQAAATPEGGEVRWHKRVAPPGPLVIDESAVRPLPTPAAPPASADGWRRRSAPPGGDVQPTAAFQPTPDVPRAPELPPLDPAPTPAAPAESIWSPRVPERRMPTELPPPESMAPTTPAGPVWSPRSPERRTPTEALVPARSSLADDPAASRLLPPPRPLAPEEVPRPREQGDEKQEEEKTLLLAAARNAVKQGNLDQALGRFEEYFRRFGDDNEVRKEYAGVLVSAGRVRQALEEYQRLAAAKPNDRELRVLVGDVAVLAKDYRLAAAELRRALELAPDNRDVAVKLARSYVFGDEFDQALQVFDRYLAQLHPGERRTPRLLGALLVDLGRPADAVPFLQDALEKDPADAEVQASLVRAYARLDERPKALELLGKMGVRETRDRSIVQDLGDALYASGEYDLAQAAFNRILQIDPNNALALLGAARVSLQLYQPQQGCKILESLSSKDETVVRLIQLTWAEYHQLVGEYLEARQIYQELLRRNPSDHEARVALAALYEFIREDEKAKAEYAKIPADAALGRRARLGIVSTLTAQRRFAEAVELAKQLAAAAPTDGRVIAQLVRTLGKASHYDEAESLARAFLEANPRNEPALLAVRLALGRVLLDAHKNDAAGHEYEIVLRRPEGRIPVAYYGAARALAQTGRQEQAHHVLEGITSPVGGDARNRLLLSDLFAGDFDDQAALEMAAAVTHYDPENLAALIRIADAQQRIAHQTGRIDEAKAAAEAVLKLSPSNVRGRLALGRTLTVGQKFVEAASAYEPLLAADPDFHLAARERARDFISASLYDAGAAAYAAMRTPSADERLRTDLLALSHDDPRAGPCLGPCLAAPLQGAALQAEATKAGRAVGGPEVEAALQRIFLDYQARLAEQHGDELEAEVKDRYWQPYAIIPVAKQLLTLEPSNTSVLFDLGQDYGSIRQTRHAIEPFGEMLAIDPGEREASIALERAALEMRPQLRLSFDFFQQVGRDGLARIVRDGYHSIVRLPYGDEDEYVDFGFSRLTLYPHNGQELPGNVLTAGFQAKECDERLFLFGQANLEAYPNRFSDRITFDVGTRYVYCDLLKGQADLFLNNVAENGESIRQDIYRYGARLTADLQPARCWTVDATYTYAHYSDQNDMNEGYFKSTTTLCFAPEEVKLVLSTDLLGYGEQTRFVSDNPDILVGTVHPYFAPHFYGYYEGRLTWKQWVSRDYFYYADQCWYSLEYGVGWDNRFNNYQVVRALFNVDKCSWLSFGADAQGTFSPVYNAVGVYAYLTARFP